MKLCETYYKFNLVIITSFCQSKNLDSFRLPLRRLWRKDVKHLKLNHSDRIFSEFRSHFRLHIQWNPFPTQQHQDHQKGGRTSCLWKFFLPKYSQLLLFKTWATKCWDNQWHWSAFLDPPYQTCSRTTRPGCRRDWMFLYFFRYLGFYLHSVGSLSHALKAALM